MSWDFFILNAISLSLLCHMEFFLQVSECDSPSSHHTCNSSSSFLYESLCGFPMTESVSKSEVCTVGASWELQFAMKSSRMVSLRCVPMRKVLVIWSMHSTNKVDFNVAPFNWMVEWCWSVSLFLLSVGACGLWGICQPRELSALVVSVMKHVEWLWRCLMRPNSL